MPFIPPELPEGSSIWAAGGTAVAAFLWLRKRLSADKLDITKDQAQIDLIASLQKERDQARLGEAEARQREDAAWKSRHEDAKLIGTLTAKVEALTMTNEALTKQVATLQKDLHDIRNYIHSEKMKGEANAIRSQQGA